MNVLFRLDLRLGRVLQFLIVEEPSEKKDEHGDRTNTTVTKFMRDKEGDEMFITISPLVSALHWFRLSM